MEQIKIQSNRSESGAKVKLSLFNSPIYLTNYFILHKKYSTHTNNNRSPKQKK